GQELRADVVGVALRGHHEPRRLGRDRRRQAGVGVAQRRDPDTGGEVQVGPAVGVVQARALAAHEPHLLRPQPGGVARLVLQQPPRGGADAHASTVPSPDRARATGRPARASPITTRPTPARSAAYAARTLRFMRPRARARASSSSAGERRGTSVAASSGSSSRPGTFERSARARAPRAAATAAAALSPSTLIGTPSYESAGGQTTGT